MDAVFKIDGVNVISMIETGGIKWQRNDVDSSTAGRTMDATMHRGRVAIKYRLDVTCRPLTQEEAQTLLPLIEPEFVEVEYIDPRDGQVTRVFYSNNVPATCMRIDEETGEATWEGISFPLVEQ